MYKIELNENEIQSLMECLGKLRSWFVRDFDDPKNEAVFVAASELHYKFAKVVYPDSNVTLDDYTDI